MLAQPQGLLSIHQQEAEHHLDAQQQGVKIPIDGRLIQQLNMIAGRNAAEGSHTKSEDNCGGTTPVTATDTSTVATILAFCAQPKSREEIMSMCGLKNKNHFIKAHLKPLLESGQLRMTIPDKPNSRNQKYVAVKPEE